MPSSPSGEELKSGSSSSGLRRRLGGKTTAAAGREDESKQFLDELEQEIDKEVDKSDGFGKRRRKVDAVDCSPRWWSHGGCCC